MTSDVLFNKDTGTVWAEFSDGTSVLLGSADNDSQAYLVVGDVGLVRMSDWLPAYGPVRSCMVAIPDRWAPPPAPK